MNDDAYADLMQRSKDVALLNSCASVLQWDQQTYMPRGGANFRGDQMAILATIAHQKSTDPRIGERLAEVTTSPDSLEAANVRELRRGYDRATKIPARLIEELARITTQAQEVWTEARAKNEFALFRPWLEQILALKREEAQAVGYADHPYDALLDEYEPGARSADLKVLFADLSRELVPLLRGIASSGKRPDRTILERDFPIDRQRIFAESAACAIGFDFAAGRLDQTTHPFCSGFGPGDCRITTRYNPRFFNEAFFGVLHEAGHGLYEQNLPATQFGTPAGAYCSLGIHESQSRLWENQVGRGQPFWSHFFPRLKQTFPSVADVTAEAFHFAINDVRPSFIRVEADEATYNLHIALRFELECEMLAGNLPVADLPEAWNARFRALFDLTPPSDREGCLQDIHWSFGGLGYFPTYTLGNLFAAQFMDRARIDLGGSDLDAAFRRGEFTLLKDWLVTNIHTNGRRYLSQDLCQRITGDTLQVAPLVNYLKAKFEPLYGL